MITTSALKEWIRNNLPWPAFWKIKRLREEGLALFKEGDLTGLAKIYKTDKWGVGHKYTPIYQRWFTGMRHRPIRLLEIGVGGYTKPLRGGESLRMWKRFFRRGIITGIDLYDKSSLKESRIKIYQGDQTDKDFLLSVHQKEGPFDIIIDDGSHIQSHIITSFESLFPVLAPGGIYVIEDTQTSYRPNYGGSTLEMNTIDSAMNYFINRIHGLNHVEWIKAEAPVNPTDQSIEGIAFYHNLIFITKKK